MKTQYQFIHFEQCHDGWFCHNNRTGDPLCWIEHYSPWRQWVVASVAPRTVFSADCLTDIADFMKQLPRQMATKRSEAKPPHPAPCPNDTNGDGDCGRPACPKCGINT